MGSDMSAANWLTVSRISVFLAASMAMSGCDAFDDSNSTSKVNGSIHVAAGGTPADAKTVNGAIHIDDNAAVLSATTVNGSIHVGAHASATQGLKTVNGGVDLGEASKVDSVQTVNGDLTVNKGALVGGELANVNGKINVSDAHVSGQIRTVGGNINVLGASEVDGGILVRKPSGNFVFTTGDEPVIVIGAGATVKGELRFERPVKLYVSDHATVGTVTGATAVPFSGDKPPL
jgi:DUF4097 and DUF4098 domain-containing protein YvlB